MTFLNPLVLIGLAAAAIPVLLHLLNLRKLKTIEFSSLTFLKELQKTKIRKLKLKQIILLILRTLLVVFIVLAFARPTIESSLSGLGTRAKTSVVVVVDNSFSMDIADERGVRLKQAKDAVLSILGALHDGDEVALLQLANLDDKRFAELTRNIAMLKEEVQNIPISYTVAHVEPGLRLASSILSTAKNINREVYVITDAQKNIFDAEKRDSLRIFDASVAVYAVPIGLESQVGERNLSIDSMHVLTQIFEIGKPVEIEARIRNSGNEDVKGVIVGLMFDRERVAQRTVDIPAGETRMVAIAGTPKVAGAVRAAIEVEGDALDADNHRYFGFVIPDKPRIALVGTPTDTRYVQLALQPTALANAPADVLTLAPEQFTATNLNEYSALFLTGISRFSQSDVARITTYVRDGGSVFLFASEKADIASYNETIIPAVGLGQLVLKEYPQKQPAEYTFVDKVHPLFTGVFKGATDGRAVVESPKVYRAAMPTGGQEIIRLPDGIMLAESKIGNGRVLYSAVPPTTQWSTFPLTGLFASLANRAVSYLSAAEYTGTSVEVGEPVYVALSGKYAAGGSFTVLDPQNTESFRQATVLPSGTVLSMDALHQPGVYIVRTAEGKTVQTIAVNPPASESALVHITSGELREQLQTYVPEKGQIEVVAQVRDIASEVSRARTGTELWKLFVLLAVVCAIVEMIVAKNSVRDAQPA